MIFHVKLLSATLIKLQKKVIRAILFKDQLTHSTPLFSELQMQPDRKRGYRGFFSPTFINPCFRYSPKVNIENLDFKNPRFSTSVFSIFTYSEYRKHGCLKISDFKHLSSEYRKLRFQKIRGFQTSPCIMCVQYIGGCSVHRGMFSTSGGVQYIGGIS